MKPQIIPADIAGKIVSWDNGSDVYYVGESYQGALGNEGIIYKDKNAFDQMQGICYIPEASFLKDWDDDKRPIIEMTKWMRENGEYCAVTDADGYTYDDLWHAFYDHLPLVWLKEQEEKYGESVIDAFVDKEIAYIFEQLDWQCPETFMDEMEWEEDWSEFIKQKGVTK